MDLEKHKLFDFLLWYSRLSRVFLKKSISQILAAFCLNIFSQTCLFLASTLPLKIIILMGSGRIPGYFPDFMTALGKNNLIYCLAVASVSFWLAFFLSDFASTRICNTTAVRIIEDRVGLIRTRRQKKKVMNVYTDYVRSISSIAFSVAALLLILFVYPAVAFASVAFIACIYVFMLIVYSCTKPKLILSIRQGAKQWMLSSSNIGFFIAFAVMVLDFTNGTMPSVLHAVISVILVRQLLKNHMRFLICLHGLYSFTTRRLVAQFYLEGSA